MDTQLYLKDSSNVPQVELVVTPSRGGRGPEDVLETSEHRTRRIYNLLMELLGQSHALILSHVGLMGAKVSPFKYFNKNAS